MWERVDILRFCVILSPVMMDGAKGDLRRGTEDGGRTGSFGADLSGEKLPLAALTAALFVAGVLLVSGNLAILDAYFVFVFAGCAGFAALGILFGTPHSAGSAGEGATVIGGGGAQGGASGDSPSKPGRRFKIYKHPNLGLDVVNIGFCWTAAFSGVWYAFFIRRLAYRKIIIAGELAILLPFVPVIFYADSGLSALTLFESIGGHWMFELFLVYCWVLFFILGSNANEWKEKWLIQNGFVPVGEIVCSGNKYDAIALAKEKTQTEEEE